MARQRFTPRHKQPPTLRRLRTPVVLNLGMGVESSAIAVEWLTNPARRWFPLHNLVVISSQVGDESDRTKWLMEHVLYPMLAAHRIRTVQVARGGPREEDGIVVLDDTRQPTICHTRSTPEKPYFRLQDELTVAGTVVTYGGSKGHICAQKYKGFVMTTWLAREFGARNYVQVMGFGAHEPKRIADDHSYSTPQRQARHPLATWGWDRERCLEQLHAKTGQWWAKSACGFCPYSNGRAHALDRFREFPADAIQSLMIEHRSMCLNPRSTIYSGKALYDVLVADGNTEALSRFAAHLDEITWAIVEVRRVFYAPAVADRCTKTLTTGTRSEMRRELRRLARQRGLTIEVSEDQRFERLIVREREVSYPHVEHTIVLSPDGVANKSRDRFEAQWQATLHPVTHVPII